MNRLRRRFTFGAVAALAIIVPTSLAWACVAPMSLTTVNSKVQPGGTVRVIGRETAPGANIEIRLDSPTGPVLAKTDNQPGGMSSKWEMDVPIPANTPYGTHVLYAVQNYRNMNSTIPRATIYVGTEPPAPATPEVRGSFDVGSGPSATSLILIGLGVAAASLLVVGGFSVMAGSKRAQPETEKVKAP